MDLNNMEQSHVWLPNPEGGGFSLVPLTDLEGFRLGLKGSYKQGVGQTSSGVAIEELAAESQIDVIGALQEPDSKNPVNGAQKMRVPLRRFDSNVAENNLPPPTTGYMWVNVQDHSWAQARIGLLAGQTQVEHTAILSSNVAENNLPPPTTGYMWVSVQGRGWAQARIGLLAGQTQVERSAILSPNVAENNLPPPTTGYMWVNVQDHSWAQVPVK